MAEIKTISVIGAGIMGNGIAQVAAQAGYIVTMMDVDENFIQRGLETIKNSLSRMTKKGKLSEKDAIKVFCVPVFPQSHRFLPSFKATSFFNMYV